MGFCCFDIKLTPGFTGVALPGPEELLEFAADDGTFNPPLPGAGATALVDDGDALPLPKGAGSLTSTDVFRL